MSVPINDRAAKDLLNLIYFTLDGYTWRECIGAESILWKQLTQEDSVLRPESIMQLRSLSEDAGGWWHFPQGIGSPGNFVTLSEWDEIQRQNRAI